MPQQHVTLNKAVELNNGRSNQPHGCEALRCVGWLARSLVQSATGKPSHADEYTCQWLTQPARATTKRGGLWRYTLWLPEHRLVHDEPSHCIRGSRAYTRNEYARLCRKECGGLELDCSSQRLARRPLAQTLSKAPRRHLFAMLARASRCMAGRMNHQACGRCGRCGTQKALERSLDTITV